MAVILLFFGLEIVAAIIVTCLLRRNKGKWSNVRVALIAALPIPLMVWLLCAYIFADATFASKEQCGVDACGMAMAAAVYGVAAGAALYVLGLVCSSITVRLLRLPDQEDVAGIFS